jgi:hypothetical protein
VGVGEGVGVVSFVEVDSFKVNLEGHGCVGWAVEMNDEAAAVLVDQ